MGEFVKLVIISHKRADRVKSARAFKNACICVEESQKEAYKLHNPDNEIVCHPDSVRGLAAKYRWIYEKFRNIVMISDEVECLYRLYIDNNPDAYVDADTAYDIIQATALTANELGVKLFGFSKENTPLTYTGHRPFRMTGLVSGGIIGILDGYQMRLDSNCVAGMDYFLSGVNAYYHRRMFVDDRFGALTSSMTFRETGGTSEYRTMDTEKQDWHYLKKLFGDAIQLKKNTRLRRLAHPYEKQLRVPF